MASTTFPAPASKYPAALEIDYPNRKLNRWTSFFRIFVIIPILIVIGLITNASIGGGEHSEGAWTWMYGGGLLFLPLVLMILFRQKYPKWWFDWNLMLTRFSYRVSSFFLLLRDEYPSTDEDQAVHLDLVYPDVKTQLGRGWPLIKWFLAIPHYVVLAFLLVAVVVCWIIAWFRDPFHRTVSEKYFQFYGWLSTLGSQGVGLCFLINH